MSAVDVTIGRLSATVYVGHTDRAAGDRDRVARLLRSVVTGRLERDLSGSDIPGGHVCIDRIDVPLSLDEAVGDELHVQSWARALSDALEGRARGGSAGVVRFRHDLAALIDAVTGILTRQLDRRWAWQQAGVCHPGDPSAETEPVAALVAALRRYPDLAAPALVAAVARCGVVQPDKMLGIEGWSQIERCVRGGSAPPAPRTAAGQRVLDVGTRERIQDRTRIGHGEPVEGASGVGDHAETWQTKPQPDIEAEPVPVPGRAQRIVAQSEVVRKVRASRLRLAPSALSALATLAMAETEPALLHHQSSATIHGALIGLLQRSSTPAAGDRGPGGPGLARRAATMPKPGEAQLADMEQSTSSEPRLPTSRDLEAGESGVPEGRDPRAGETGLPRRADRDATESRVQQARDLEATRGRDVGSTAAESEDNFGGARATAWAGLPFLLATADEVGLPDRVSDDPVLGRRALAWVMQQMGIRLAPIEDDDPAIWAFAGLAEEEARRLDRTPVSADEESALRRIADEWAVAVRERLITFSPNLVADGSDVLDDGAAVARVACRDGHVQAERGWIEVVLAVDQADVAVRRGGFDLDPGWVPWLGAVVRYRYA